MLFNRCYFWASYASQLMRSIHTYVVADGGKRVKNGALLGDALARDPESALRLKDVHSAETYCVQFLDQPKTECYGYIL